MDLQCSLRITLSKKAFAILHGRHIDDKTIVFLLYNLIAVGA